jgi:hypothetical protein
MEGGREREREKERERGRGRERNGKRAIEGWGGTVIHVDKEGLGFSGCVCNHQSGNAT